MSQIVLVERDFKGIYERFALTLEEFAKEYGPASEEAAPEAEAEAATWTLSPLVHIWYQVTELGSSLFNTFFKDMSWGLPESDLESMNLAYIREEYITDTSIRSELSKMGVLCNG